MIIEGCVRWSLVHAWNVFLISAETNLEPLGPLFELRSRRQSSFLFSLNHCHDWPTVKKNVKSQVSWPANLSVLVRISIPRAWIIFYRKSGAIAKSLKSAMICRMPNLLVMKLLHVLLKSLFFKAWQFQQNDVRFLQPAFLNSFRLSCWELTCCDLSFSIMY